MSEHVGPDPGYDSGNDHVDTWTRLTELVADVLSYVLGVVLVAATIAVTIGVISRRVLSYSIPWAVDAAALSMVAVTFLGATLVALRGGHITVDLVTSRLEGRAEARLEVVSLLISVITLLVVSAAALDHVVNDLISGRRYIGNYLIFPRAWIMSVLPVGLLMLSVVKICQLTESWHRLRAMTGQDENPGAPRGPSFTGGE